MQVKDLCSVTCCKFVRNGFARDEPIKVEVIKADFKDYLTRTYESFKLNFASVDGIENDSGDEDDIRPEVHEVFNQMINNAIVSKMKKSTKRKQKDDLVYKPKRVSSEKSPKKSIKEACDDVFEEPVYGSSKRDPVFQDDLESISDGDIDNKSLDSGDRQEAKKSRNILPSDESVADVYIVKDEIMDCLPENPPPILLNSSDPVSFEQVGMTLPSELISSLVKNQKILQESQNSVEKEEANGVECISDDNLFEEEGEILSEEDILRRKAIGELCGDNLSNMLSMEKFGDVVDKLGNAYLENANESDEYIIKDLDEDDSDADDLLISSSDNLLVVGKVLEGGDVAEIDVHLYNYDEEENYSHHDYFLPSFPLSIEWFNFNRDEPDSCGNFVAVGTVEPQIEVWNLDLIEALGPTYKLGLPKSLVKNNPDKLCGHKNAVVTLAWNEPLGKVLASGSADHKIGIWDLEQMRAVCFLIEHSRQVSKVSWHKLQPNVLASGSYDKAVHVTECRSDGATLKWKFDAKVEDLCWTLSPYQMMVALSNGHICCIDTRVTKTIFYDFVAHQSSVTGLSFNPLTPQVLASISEDGFLKLWNILDDAPYCLKTRNMRMGMLTCIDHCPNQPYIYSVGGHTSSVRIVDFASAEYNLDTENGCWLIFHCIYLISDGGTEYTATNHILYTLPMIIGKK